MANVQDQVDKEKENTSNEITLKIKDLFGEEILQAFKREEVDNEHSVADLLTRKADAPIFGRLSLSYGKAVRFKKEFAWLKKESSETATSGTLQTAYKPSMADLSKLSPEMRQLYLSKRKRIGVLASNKWKSSLPRFNSPEVKAELEQFAEEIESECGIAEINFGKEGIVKHIKSFFNEQRRYKKRKTPSLEQHSLSQLPAKKEKTHSTFSSSDLEESSTDEPHSVVAESGGDTEPVVSSEEEDFISASQQSASPKTTDKKSSSSTEDMEDDLPLKIRQYVVKRVFGKSLDRSEVVEVLKKKFQVHAKHLTELTVSELLSVLARKLVKLGYVALKNNCEPSSAQSKDVIIMKEIQI